MEGPEAKNKRLGRTWRFLHKLAHRSIERIFGYSFEPMELEAPFLLISNHVTNSDPFLVGVTSKSTPLAFVASEHIFRQGLVTRLINRIFAPIPRSKAASGAGTVKAILKNIREGRAVALFAEGDCTWDGETKPVFPATGKLAKTARVPLVTFRLEGGYLVSPRWSKKLRRASMRGGAVRVYSPEELAGMAPEEIDAAINRDIYENVWERQSAERIPIRSKARAEGLERALFICPECGSAVCMSTKGGKLTCAVCRSEWNMDEYGFLDGPRFKTVMEWDEWQKEEIRNIRGRSLFAGKCVYSDIDSGKRTKTIVRLDTIGLRILLDGRGEIPFSDITDMAMVKTNRLLFTDGAGYHEITVGINGTELRPYLIAWQASRSIKEG